MNAIVNMFVLAAGKCMPKMYLNSLDLQIVLVAHSLKIKKEQKGLKKQEIQDIFIKTNKIKLVPNMI